MCTQDLGTGFSDDDLAKHSEFFSHHLIDQAKPYFQYSASLQPDHWFEPVQVWEVKASDLSISPAHKAAIGMVSIDSGNIYVKRGFNNILSS
ncbi:unnamed protein product [Protopolystoma xenopodis]|uniref:DNA ligase ATP-dependent C-terminal domain-containing protein n=1 Tax=Protopolystoma xenopodis TaxID=117903 RepID=A0A448WTG4_9PLAT|nr:unnamed protein product [Protopolystoma xenopodis]